MSRVMNTPSSSTICAELKNIEDEIIGDEIIDGLFDIKGNKSGKGTA